MSKAKKSRTNRPDKGNEIKMAQEAEWVQRVSQGDPDALDKLYEKYFDRVYLSGAKLDREALLPIFTSGSR